MDCNPIVDKIEKADKAIAEYFKRGLLVSQNVMKVLPVETKVIFIV
jgi:hypothetical protein